MRGGCRQALAPENSSAGAMIAPAGKRSATFIRAVYSAVTDCSLGGVVGDAQPVAAGDATTERQPGRGLHAVAALLRLPARDGLHRCRRGMRRRRMRLA